MVNDNSLTPLPSQCITPVSSPNIKTLQTILTDHLEKTHIPNSQNSLSLSLPMGQWMQVAQTHKLVILPTQPSTTPLLNSHSTAWVVKVTLPIWLLLKPPDYQNHNHEQKTPQQPNGPPQRKFCHSTTALNSPMFTTHNSQSQNAAQLWTSKPYEKKNSSTKMQHLHPDISYRDTQLCQRGITQSHPTQTQQTNWSNKATWPHILTLWWLPTLHYFGCKCKSTIPALANGNLTMSQIHQIKGHP